MRATTELVEPVLDNLQDREWVPYEFDAYDLEDIRSYQQEDQLAKVGGHPANRLVVPGER